MTSNASPSGRASGGWPRGTPYGRLSPDSHCNIFDPGEGDDDGDEIETLREANAEIQNLKQKLQHYRSTVGAAGTRLLIWKPHSLSAMPAHPLTVTKPSDILALRKYLFEWLGYYSFGLRLSPQERKMLTATTLATLEANEKEFRVRTDPAGLPASFASSRRWTDCGGCGENYERP